MGSFSVAGIVKVLEYVRKSVPEWKREKGCGRERGREKAERDAEGCYSSLDLCLNYVVMLPGLSYKTTVHTLLCSFT